MMTLKIDGHEYKAQSATELIHQIKGLHWHTTEDTTAEEDERARNAARQGRHRSKSQGDVPADRKVRQLDLRGRRKRR